jgi:hypothetical protein
MSSTVNYCCVTLNALLQTAGIGYIHVVLSSLYVCPALLTLSASSVQKLFFKTERDFYTKSLAI